MANKNGNDVQAAIYAYLRAKPQLTSLLANAGQIKELQWQGQDFVYPAVRISVDFMPAVNGCQDRADIYIDVFSELKTSDQASTIAGVIQGIFHRKPFTSAGVSFFSVVVEKVNRPERSIFGWQSTQVVKTILT